MIVCCNSTLLIDRGGKMKFLFLNLVLYKWLAVGLL